ncbi:hypothetical protein PVAND_016410 [Polypedilum vanderplanki]|uniref:Clathrin light chain n=1 Tax=Polypedilum vanderplanki TaxID=319348 RepID=A0A9J6BG64_POLVA|nr:hypothetical protein PVAND_016410 [Polypedilum vanderplanki]
MSGLVEDFLAREKDGLAGLEDEIPQAFQENGNFRDQDEQHNSFSNASDRSSSTEVPEKIKKWREEQQLRLQEKDAAEEKAKEALRKQAEKELEDWYKRHEETIAKTKTLNRNAEKECVAEVEEMEPGTEWERISKLCDFAQSTKASKSLKDNSRMRSIILQLKQSPLDREKA